MNTETLTAVPAEQTLIDCLYDLKPEERETRESFLGRAAIVAGEFADHILSEEEITYVGQMLEGWKFSTARVHTKRFGVARRLELADKTQYLKNIVILED